MIRGIRGAVTVEADRPEEVLAETRALVLEMVNRNNIDPEDVASVIISATHDIKSSFPAKAVRSIEGWTYVPVMCTHEMDVPGALPHCIRVMMHVNTEVQQQEVRHTFLKGAAALRPDLAQGK
ncbi:chorismate mutase [Planococcus lenghuensis]|uniref:chorismate mutase n=1 Tax=Planococcus lenghuensis TaxID=2213202 RepID=A0A1Q2KZK1_9BACL|nr:chorismate mutase [Planococcus lenghuensis]AQQ53625.1 chorismate mutase [Planococcus lenghuensis]